MTLHGREAIVQRTAPLAGGSSRNHRGTTPGLELLDERSARRWRIHRVRYTNAMTSGR